MLDAVLGRSPISQKALGQPPHLPNASYTTKWVHALVTQEEGKCVHIPAVVGDVHWYTHLSLFSSTGVTAGVLVGIILAIIVLAIIVYWPSPRQRSHWSVYISCLLYFTSCLCTVCMQRYTYWCADGVYPKWQYSQTFKKHWCQFVSSAINMYYISPSYIMHSETVQLVTINYRSVQSMFRTGQVTLHLGYIYNIYI